MDLQEAAQKALDQLKELVVDFDEGDKCFEGLDEKMETVSKQLDEDWPKIADGAKGLIEELNKAKDALEAEADDSGKLLRDLKAKLDGLKDDAESALDGAKSEVDAVTARTEDLEPMMDAALDLVEQVGNELKERADAIEQALDEATKDVSDFLTNEITSQIKGFEDDVNQRVSALQEYVTDTCLPDLESKAEELFTKLGEFKDDFEETLETLGSKVKEGATEAFAECLKKHTEVFEEFAQLGEQAKSIMTKLGDAIDTGATQIGEGKQLVDAGVSSTSVGLRAGVGTLQEIMEMFKRFSFIPL